MKFTLLLLPLLGLGCAGLSTEPHPILSFRFESDAGAPDSIVQTLDDGTSVRFGPVEVFGMAYVGPSVDRHGDPVIMFEIHDDDAQRFSDLTETFTGKRLAIYVDGEFLTAPEINERLPGAGIISGGAQGFTKEQRDDLIHRLRAQEQLK